MVEADQGKYLRVRVSFQDDDGNDETATSDATGPVAAEPNVAATGQPTISGTAQVGEDLSAQASGISDGNGLTTVSYSYQWLRADTANGDGAARSRERERDLHGGRGGPEQVPPSAGELPGRRRERGDGDERCVGTGVGGGERGGDGPADDQRDSQVGQDLTASVSGISDERTDESDVQLPVAACRDGSAATGAIRSRERDLQAGGGGPGQVPPCAGELPGR